MNNNLVQMIYISRSTFATTGNSSTVDPSVARILAKSRSNNRKRGLVGVLYFGDGCFFQCLEGKGNEVDALYEILLKDKRHKDLKVLSRKTITRPSFSEWSMKYIALDTEIKQLMAKNGYEKFDPYLFDNDMTAEVLELLHLANDVNLTNNPVVETNTLSLSTPANDKAIHIAKWAISIAIISVLISAYTLMVKA